jgi:hypothetical protein
MTNRRHGESSWNSGCVGFSYDFWNRGCRLEKIAAFGSSYAPVGAAEGCDLLNFLLIFASARFVNRALQAEFLFAFDLDHLGVVHGDFHCAETQIAQGALDLAQNGCFVLAVNAT